MGAQGGEIARVRTARIWDARRRALQRVLGKQDSICGELYERALDALGEDPLTDGALVIASHCIRELVNRLGRLRGDVLTGKGLGLTSAVEGLAKVWAVNSEPVIHAAESGESAPQLELTALIDSVRSVVGSFDAGRASAVSLRSVLAVGNSVELDNPTVKSFKRATDAFERFRHPQGNTQGWPRDAEPLLPHLRVIEDAIEGRIGSFFEVVEDVRALLIEVNRRSDGGDWQPPTDELFARVISRIGDLQHRRVFFAELRNPLWVSRLLKAGALKPPTVPPDDANGWIPWPAGPYLVKVAAENPQDVSTALELILRQQDQTREVRDFAVKSAARMPAEVVASLVPVLQLIPAVTLDPVIGLGIARLIEKLGLGGHGKAALRLGGELLRPRVSPSGQRWSEVTAGIESYWYGEAVGHFCAGLADNPRLLPTLIRWLKLALDAEGADPSAAYDLSYLWRPAIGDAGRRDGRHDMREVLVDAVRDVAIATLATTVTPEQVITSLEGGGYQVLRRIARHVLAETVTGTSPALDLAFERLLDTGPLNGLATPREYLELASATLPLLDDGRYREWEALALAGPQDSAGKRERIRAHLKPGQTEDGVWTEYAERWLLDVLGTIGAGALRGQAHVRLAGLTASLGAPHDPSLAGITVERDGAADAEATKLRGLTVDEIIEFARGWTPSGRGEWDTDSFDVGQAFASAVEERPLEFSQHAHDVVVLPELFVGRFFDGLRQAIDSAKTIDWPMLLDALSAMPGGPSVAAATDRRPTYSIRAAMYVLQAGQGKASSSGFVAGYVDKSLDFTLRYMGDPEPLPDSPMSVGEIAGDPLTTALNAVRPIAVATSIRLAYFAKAKESSTAADMITRVTEALSGLLQPERVESSALAAAFGTSFGQLYWLVPEWLEVHSAQLLGEDWYGDVVASVALLSYERPLFLRVMDGKLAEFIARSGQGEPFDWTWTQRESIIERLGECLLRLVLLGERDLTDELVSQYLLSVQAEVRGAVLSDIGRRLAQDDRVPEDVLARARSLWDARAEVAKQDSTSMVELKDFYTWVHSGKFAVDWWLPRLREVALSTDLEGLTYLGEHLVEAAQHDPATAVEVLSTVVRRVTVSWARYDLIEHAPQVIAHALASTDEATAEAARDLIDYLGREGYLNMSDLVAEAQAVLEESSELGRIEDGN
ncbi:hypothetical protein [Kribbella ginsengisoli]|uniref:Uncharacterized protein n=1 Tax=Kribbella ginsengisoli TaxID=363865 RepID=A0ABP6VNE2_9ACTN